MLLKYRFSKQYRHATLDASLTRARVAGEARAILRCLRYVFEPLFPGRRSRTLSRVRYGVSVPGLRFVDAASGALGIEWVSGKSIRTLLGSGDEGEETYSEQDEDVAPTEDGDPLAEFGVTKGMSCLIYHS